MTIDTYLTMTKNKIQLNRKWKVEYKYSTHMITRDKKMYDFWWNDENENKNA